MRLGVRTLDRYGLYERLSRATEASTSIERRDEAARAEVKRRGGRVVGAFVDEGVSGALPPMDRPAMKELLQQLSGMDAVMVWKIDRIARSFLGFAEIVKELDKHGVALVSATEPIDMTGPTGRAMAQMIAVFAELEREMIKARVADSMRKAKEENRFHGGRIPYGLTVADHPSGKGRVLVRDTHAVGVLREVLLWVLEGATMAECARRLNDRKEPTSRQRGAVLKGLAKAEAAQWRGVSLKRILASPTMLGCRLLPGGKVQTNGDGLPVLVWDPVFSRDEWDALQTCLAELEQGPRKAPAASHWLSGCLKCSVCGGNLKQWVSGTGLRAFTCRGRETAAHSPSVYVPADLVADWVREQFPVVYGILPEVERRWVPGSDTSRELSEVRAAIRRLRDDRDIGLFDDDEDDYRERMARLVERRKVLQTVPQVEPHWEEHRTGRSLAEVWSGLSDERRGALMIEYGLALWVDPAPTKAKNTPINSRAQFGPSAPAEDALAAIAYAEGVC
ncbi:recombinase family protein [Kitasatospora sp. MMS16-BH015]|uniref:recombinase family protein n=1 Tax=Kitasatospora sp. MMS16-BH015 TaxID=2018025 RepID=UPI000CF1D0D2|nr:recombinase family protein [Kitasatospora sp. MMS16-BH015]